jgi:EryCIII-like glycosyltransferase
MTLGSLWMFAAPTSPDVAAAAAGRVDRRLLLLGDPTRRRPACSAPTTTSTTRGSSLEVTALIHHGGAGTTAAAAHAGVANVIVPCYGNQSFWARRMKSLGIAPAPIPIRRLNAERLVVALDQTLKDAQIGDRAAELARRVRRDHGVEVACGVIEHGCGLPDLTCGMGTVVYTATCAVKKPDSGHAAARSYSCISQPRRSCRTIRPILRRHRGLAARRLLVQPRCGRAAW